MDLLTNLFRTPANMVSPTETQKKLALKPKPILLDVRQPEEFQTAHIAGAKLIPLGELQTRLNELPKNQEIICVCRSGNRSLTATRLLNAAGYRAANLQGGMIAWARSGFAVNKSEYTAA